MNIHFRITVKKGCVALLAVILIFLLKPALAQDGEQLFQQCKACHTIGQGKLLGPDLLDISKRQDKEWIKNFIKSSQTMIKNGDPAAVAIFEEFNKLIMIDYNWPDADLEAVIKYIDSFSKQDADEAPVAISDSLKMVQEAEFLASIDTDENEAKGKALFDGSRNFKNGGAACIACHHVNALEKVHGGLLSKDLTNTFSRIGGFAGIKGILSSPPYPAMKDAYAHAQITEDESIQLQVFLMRADKKGEIAQASIFDLMKQGIIGVVVLLIIISLVWFKRKKRSVNYQIIQRQNR
jgi:mono/diheme cytochrome c family protein